MEKCLVTKLKGVVSNESLPAIDEIILYGHSTTKFSNGVGGLVTKGAKKIRLIGDAYFTDKTGAQNLGKEKSIDTTYEGQPYPNDSTDLGKLSYIKCDNEYQVAISSKYSIERFTGGCDGINRIGNTALVYPYNVDVFKYSKELVKVECDYMYMQYTIDKNEELGLNGDISVFADKKNLEMLHVGGYYNKSENVNIHIKLYGDLSSLSNCTKLTSLNVNNSDVSGKIEDLLNALHSNGRNDGELQIFATNTPGVTLNGEAITQKVFTFNTDGWSAK